MPLKRSTTKANRKKVIYLISPLIKWQTFKMLSDKLVDKQGPYPLYLDKVLYKLIKDKMIYAWFVGDGDMRLNIRLPKNVKIKIISSPK